MSRRDGEQAARSRAARWMALVGALAGGGACLPNGPPTGMGEVGGGASTSTAAPKPVVRTVSSALAVAASDPLLGGLFADDFERAELGDAWRTTGNGWRIVQGRLCAEEARNRGIWLRRRLPVNARIEFDAISSSSEGDLKAELWGDGVSGATTSSYSNATSYLAILGGWKNSLHVLARLDEHGADRLMIRVGAAEDDPRAQPVTPGQPYHFRIERTDGRTLAWYVDDVLFQRLVDDAPLQGVGHDHLGFNDWQVPVCFDNVRISPLPG